MVQEFWEVMRGKIGNFYPTQTSQIEVKGKLALVSFFFRKFISSSMFPLFIFLTLADY